MTEVFALFQPGLQHLIDERERKRHDLVVPGDAAPPFGVDLDAGVAYLEPAPNAEPAPNGEPAPNAEPAADHEAPPSDAAPAEDTTEH